MNAPITKIKSIVRVSGEVQFPLKVGERACYRKGGNKMFTDRVKKILEVSAGFVRLETLSFYYTIEHSGDAGQMQKIA